MMKKSFFLDVMYLNGKGLEELNGIEKNQLRGGRNWFQFFVGG